MYSNSELARWNTVYSVLYTSAETVQNSGLCYQPLILNRKIAIAPNLFEMCYSTHCPCRLLQQTCSPKVPLGSAIPACAVTAYRRRRRVGRPPVADSAPAPGSRYRRTAAGIAVGAAAVARGQGRLGGFGAVLAKLLRAGAGGLPCRLERPCAEGGECPARICRPDSNGAGEFVLSPGGMLRRQTDAAPLRTAAQCQRERR